MNKPNQMILQVLQALVHFQYTRNSKSQVIQEVIDDLLSQSEDVILAIGDIAEHTIVLKLPEVHVLYALAVYRNNALHGIRLFREKFTEKISRKPLALAYGGIETFFFEKEGTITSMYEYKLGVSGCLLKKSF